MLLGMALVNLQGSIPPNISDRRYPRAFAAVGTHSAGAALQTAHNFRFGGMPPEREGGFERGCAVL